MTRRFIETFGIAMVTGVLLVALSACEQPGPAEKAGEKLDNAVEKTGEQLEDAGDSIRDATTPGGN